MSFPSLNAYTFTILIKNFPRISMQIWEQYPCDRHDIDPSQKYSQWKTMRWTLLLLRCTLFKTLDVALIGLLISWMVPDDSVFLAKSTIYSTLSDLSFMLLATLLSNLDCYSWWKCYDVCRSNFLVFGQYPEIMTFTILDFYFHVP